VRKTIPSVIEDIKARKILDSRGKWTVEIDVFTVTGFGRCAAPSGASTGRYEVVSYPENSVDKALERLEEIVVPELLGMVAEEQEEVDGLLKELDGTENFSKIGGNVAVAVSLATAKAASSSYNLPLYRYLGGSFSSTLPYPLGNVIGGGAHAEKATDIQEFLVIPTGANNILEAVTVNTEVHRRIKKELARTGSSALGKGDEGAWAPSISDKEALEVLSKICRDVEEDLGITTRLGVDVAASELWSPDKKAYIYPGEKMERSRDEQIDYIADLIERYGLYYVEDPLEEEDFEGFAELNNRTKALVCGDDLYVTNSKRIKEGIERGSTKAVLIKPNQVGTLTDTFKAVHLAKNNKIATVISHRSGETLDETIAHLAVAFGCPVIKTGVIGGERAAKLNELIRIEEELDRCAEMAPLPGLED
jgi:enolase